MDARSAGYEASAAEDLFVDLLQEALGLEIASALVAEYPVTDLLGAPRRLDFALFARSARYAFEVDGEYWHRPDSPMVSTEKFRGDLLKQNSLIHAGWKLFRFSDGQLVEEREQVVEQLRLFLEEELRGGTFDAYLPCQDGEAFSLREHQREALAHLAALRAQGKSIALLTHATGSGKTTTAIHDCRALGRRVLYLVHRRELVRQTLEAFAATWPQVECEAYAPARAKPAAHVVVGTYQGVGRHLDRFHREEFGYLVADEAHHVPAPAFRKALEYFHPQFTLGLTATAERSDGRSLLQLFQETAPRLGLREAIGKGLLAPIRCVRVRTSVDLGRLRYNGNDYRLRDLEQGVSVPERDRLIVDTYRRHVCGKPAVAFCVNVDHAERLAAAFRQAGVAAEAVSGRLPVARREEVLGRYAAGDLAMLCACDLLNEGWDSPRTEVLLMARPTMSRVLYIQQLGRGTRLAPGKECLYVLDFIDNAGRYAQSLSVHRLFGQRTYRPGALVAAPEEQLAQEQAALAAGEVPVPISHLGLYVDRVEEVDIFDWKTAVAGMLTLAELEVELGVGENTALHWVRQGKVAPDHTIELGTRTYHYFDKSRVEELRRQFGLRKRTPETRKVDLLEFVGDMTMSSSYKPVMLLALLHLVDGEGKCRLEDLVARFHRFYVERAARGLVVERGRSRLGRPEELAPGEIESIILTMPFEKFERRKFLRRDRDAAIVRFDPYLWRSLSPEDLSALRAAAEQALRHYYERGAEQ